MAKFVASRQSVAPGGSARPKIVEGEFRAGETQVMEAVLYPAGNGNKYLRFENKSPTEANQETVSHFLYIANGSRRLELGSDPLFGVDPAEPDFDKLYGKIDNMSVIFPFAPQDLKHGGAPAAMSAVSRPGLPPLLITEGRSLRNCSFSTVISYRGGTSATYVEDILHMLSVFAENGITVRFNYGLKALPYDAVISSLDITDTYRNAAGFVVRASVSIALTERVQFVHHPTPLKAVFKSDSLKVGAGRPKPKDTNTFPQYHSAFPTETTKWAPVLIPDAQNQTVWGQNPI